MGENVIIALAEAELEKVPVAELDTVFVADIDNETLAVVVAVEHDVPVEDAENVPIEDTDAHALGVDVEEVVDDGELLTVDDFLGVSDCELDWIVVGEVEPLFVVRALNDDEPDSVETEVDDADDKGEIVETIVSVAVVDEDAVLETDDDSLDVGDTEAVFVDVTVLIGDEEIRGLRDGVALLVFVTVDEVFGDGLVVCVSVRDEVAVKDRVEIAVSDVVEETLAEVVSEFNTDDETDFFGESLANGESDESADTDGLEDKEARGVVEGDDCILI